MELSKTAEEEVIYEGFKILARLMAQAVMREISVKDGALQIRDVDLSFPQNVNYVPSSQQEKLVLSVSEAAKLLGISRSAIYLAVNSAQIPSIRFGRRILIPRAALISFLNTGHR